MSGKLRVLISAILLTPAAALGLGLGEIRLNSSLNEPLSAEIDLVAATPEELATLNAQLASQEVFARYGLDRPAYLGSLEFSVGRGQDGRSVLLVQLPRRDQRTVRFIPDRRELAARQAVARVHGAARPAGHAGVRRQSGPGAGRCADDGTAAARGSGSRCRGTATAGTADAGGNARGERRFDLRGCARRHAL